MTRSYKHLTPPGAKQQYKQIPRRPNIELQISSGFGDLPWLCDVYELR
jgi:hypothetical protein